MQYQQVQRWNGTLPTFTGEGVVPLVNMTALLGTTGMISLTAVISPTAPTSPHRP